MRTPTIFVYLTLLPASVAVFGQDDGAPARGAPIRRMFEVDAGTPRFGRAAAAPAVSATPLDAAFSADLDGRGGLERIQIANDGRTRVDGDPPRTLRIDGLRGAIAVAVADCDGDGRPEFVGGFEAEPRIRGFDPEGAALYAANVPRVFDAFAVVDDGDGFDDVVVRFGGRDVGRYQLEAAPAVVFDVGGPLRRLDAVDLDRDGRLEAVLTDRAGVVHVFDRGRLVRTIDVGAPVDAFAAIACDDDSFLPLDVVVVANGALKAFRHDGTLRFETPFAGAPGNLGGVELRGGPPAEIVATSFHDGTTSIRAFTTKGEPFFNVDVKGKLRGFTSATPDPDGRRRLTAISEDAGKIVVYDAGGDGSSRFIDLGEPPTSFTVVNVVGDGRPEIVALTAAGVVKITDPAGAVLHVIAAPEGRVAEVRVLDVDGDDRRDVVATLADGGGVAVFEPEGKLKARIAPPPRFRGAGLRFVDLDRDGPREFILVKEVAAKAGERKTVVAAFDVDGRLRFETTLRGGRARHTTADVDADGKEDVVVWTDRGVLHAVDRTGWVFWRTPVAGPVSGLRATDFDRDGAPDVLIERPSGRVEAWWPPPRDRRPRGPAFLRALFGF